jgi:hypothetical protein
MEALDSGLDIDGKSLTEKTPIENGWGFVLVEAVGIEPTSESLRQQNLHA